MTILTRRSLLRRSALFGAGLLAAPAVAKSGARRSLTLASLFGEDKPETRIWRLIEKLVDEKLPGRFRFNLVGSAALGGEKEVAEGLRLGSVQASLSTVSALAGWVPEVQLLDLPFLFRDAAHLRAVVSGPIGAEIKSKLAAQHFIVPDFINYGARHLLTKAPVVRPEQLSGTRIRVIQNQTHRRLWSAFGATPIGLPIPETYDALRNGVAEAMDLTKSAYAGFRLYEVAPFLTETGHIWASGVVYFAAPFWNALTEEEQEVFQEAAAAGAAAFDAWILEDEALSMATAAAQGGEVLQPEDREAWEAGGRSVWGDLAEAVGGMEKIEAARETL